MIILERKLKVIEEIQFESSFPFFENSVRLCCVSQQDVPPGALRSIFALYQGEVISLLQLQTAGKRGPLETRNTFNFLYEGNIQGKESR